MRGHPSFRIPANNAEPLVPIPLGIQFQNRVSETTDIVQVFGEKKSSLATDLRPLRKLIRQDGTIWISWAEEVFGSATRVTDRERKDGGVDGVIDTTKDSSLKWRQYLKLGLGRF